MSAPSAGLATRAASAKPARNIFLFMRIPGVLLEVSDGITRCAAKSCCRRATSRKIRRYSCQLADQRGCKCRKSRPRLPEGSFRQRPKPRADARGLWKTSVRASVGCAHRSSNAAEAPIDAQEDLVEVTPDGCCR